LAAPKAPPFAIPTWIRPIPVPAGANRLAGGWASFDLVDIVQRDEAGYSASRHSPDEVLATADDRNQAAAVIDRLTAARVDWAGLPLDRPAIMGILNVTPDSFSDGGRHNAPARAIAAARAMIEAGAGIVDIGGESTRPGAEPVTRNQELARVLPPIAGLRDSGALLSIDTRHAEVMTRATAAGAGIINDVNGLRGEGALNAAAASGAAVAIMHMQGTPETMQQDPHYGFAPVEIYEFLEDRITGAEAAGISRAQIAIDPGFGFGKSPAHNLSLIGWTAMFHGLGVPILVGASRKSSIATLSAGEGADHRLAGSLGLAMAAVVQGCQLLRVHDVAETRQALAIQMALAASA
jgi:dihydropteroate synthase